MKLAVLEAVSAGLCGVEAEASWEREGLAMWQALVTDLAAVSRLRVETVLQRRWQAHQPRNSTLSVWLTEGAAEATSCWRSVLENAEGVLVVAPECGGQLASLVAAIPSTLVAWNCTPLAIEHCAEKHKLSQSLQPYGCAVIPTQVEDWQHPPTPNEFPCVVKPADGAGSHLVRLINHSADWNQARREFLEQGTTHALRQPYLSGRAVSIAGWFGRNGAVDWLPVAEQRLSKDGRFRYLGGRIPATLTDDQHQAVLHCAQQAAASLPGLCGYVGCDLILPAGNETAPVLVEINPRLTTSYVGYRQWWQSCPWERWLSEPFQPSSLKEGQESVKFDADGTILEAAVP